MASEFRPDLELWSVSSADARLRFLKESFLESYLNSIERHADLPFLACYGTDGEIRRFTFKEFDKAVCGAAARLKRESADGDTIMIVGRNTFESLVYLVAALLVGRTVCPMNPEEGLERILEKQKILAVPLSIWVDRKHAELGKALEAKWLDLAPAAKAAFVSFAADQPMVLIFTSGSTGYSKVVQQTELGILSNVDATIEIHKLQAGICVATPLPTFHVNALEFSFLCTLLSGARLVLWENFVAPVILETVQKERCDILSLVPPLIRLLTQRLVQAERYDLSSLKYIVTAAAPLSVELTLLALQRLQVPVIQAYGLSEAINFTCSMPVDLPEPEYLKWMTKYPWPSIGPSVRGNDVAILNESLEPVLEGEAGELCIRGPVVMSSYMHDQEKKVFEGSYLHTGDLATFHRDAHGRPFHFIIGRKKETIKRFGLTVSLREVDDLLARFNEPGFDAIAVAFANDWSVEDVGVVVSRSAHWDSEAEKRLSHHLESVLPSHLRPRVVFLSERPLRTASGKPCRWHFAQLFERFQKQMLPQPTQFLADESSPGAGK